MTIYSKRFRTRRTAIPSRLLHRFLLVTRILLSRNQQYPVGTIYTPMTHQTYRLLLMGHTWYIRLPLSHLIPPVVMLERLLQHSIFRALDSLLRPPGHSGPQTLPALIQALLCLN